MTTFAERMKERAGEVADVRQHNKLQELKVDWMDLIQTLADEGEFTVDTFYNGREKQYPAWDDMLKPLLEAEGLTVVFVPGDYQEMMSYDRTYISWK
jgi:hypothetical protein